MVSPNLLRPTGHFTEIMSLPEEPRPSWMQRVRARARVAHLARITGLLPWQRFTETVADHSVRLCGFRSTQLLFWGLGALCEVKWSEGRGCIHPPQRPSLTVMFAWSLSLGCNESVCWWRCAVSVVFLWRPSGWRRFSPILMLLETNGSTQRNGHVVLFIRIWGGTSNNNNLSAIRVQMLGLLLLFSFLADHSDGISAFPLAQQLQWNVNGFKKRCSSFFFPNFCWTGFRPRDGNTRSTFPR